MDCFMQLRETGAEYVLSPLPDLVDGHHRRGKRLEGLGVDQLGRISESLAQRNVGRTAGVQRNFLWKGTDPTPAWGASQPGRFNL